ncbi:type II toxin-antitoxin system HicB family antitoxin [Sphingomonas sp. RB56-2]|uniref:Type II toxin-antitoxin system HicB family antitoxin n=1 Tax=Sphingomonas brevis TaxID=2908206 RepID=A0ABT0S705_9SPHN|nr:toxin-antitoxin system HicB family antitoxin [Sphingomonas brevis]MCL6739881.1 type II toxin-antitoxin system HicB family antitoxin [Sphingomonas brevis]
MARKKVMANEGQPIDASARLRMPYGRLLIPEEEGGYRAEILEFPGCIAEGDDAEEALAELEAAAEEWIEAALEMGSPIPPPLDEANFSGRLNLRLPKSLHRKATLAAELDGVSLNQLIVASIAECLGQKSSAAMPKPEAQCLWFAPQGHGYTMGSFAPNAGHLHFRESIHNSADHQMVIGIMANRGLFDANR